MAKIDFEIICECGYDSSGSGSYGYYIDREIGEIVCTHCGLVQDNYVFIGEEIYERKA